MTSDDEGYQGWSSHATGRVKWWIDHDEDLSRHWRETARRIWRTTHGDATFSRREQGCSILAKTLKDEVAATMPNLDRVWQNLLMISLGSVDWYEIADNLLDELPGEETATVADEDAEDD